MTFSIAFQKEPLCYPYDDQTTPAASGLLVLGSTKESFFASLHQWRQRDYEGQWKQAIGILLNERNKAALITEYVGPEASTHLVWWPMYVVGSDVYVQNHLLFYNQLPTPFSLEKASSFLCDRQTVNEEGKRISEWKVTLSDVQAFANTL